MAGPDGALGSLFLPGEEADHGWWGGQGAEEAEGQQGGGNKEKKSDAANIKAMLTQSRHYGRHFPWTR